MPNSMTGYAQQSGITGPWRWTIELRSVNGRGLDLRLRAPDWVDGLDQKLKAALAGVAARGSLTLSVRINREEGGPKSLDPAALAGALDQIAMVTRAAQERGLALSPGSACDVLGLRGVTDSGGAQDTGKLVQAMLGEVPALASDFNAMRGEEGKRLEHLIRDQLDQIARGATSARAIAEDRRQTMDQNFRDNLARIADNAEGFDPDRVAQEIALLSVRADITEELDRLDAHVAAARKLLDTSGPVGRKLDFLCQEFNREANTLCSKSQFTALTAVGLDLKTVIDQMREQIQNLE